MGTMDGGAPSQRGGGADKAKRGGEDTAATAEVFLRASTSLTTSLGRGLHAVVPCSGPVSPRLLVLCAAEHDPACHPLPMHGDIRRVILSQDGAWLSATAGLLCSPSSPSTPLDQPYLSLYLQGIFGRQRYWALEYMAQHHPLQPRRRDTAGHCRDGC